MSLSTPSSRNTTPRPQGGVATTSVAYPAGVRSSRFHSRTGGLVRLRRRLCVIICCACAPALLLAACGGGSSGTAQNDSSVPTATLPAKLPDPLVLGNGAIQASGASTYTIKSGDTLAGIASQFGVSLDDLRTANPGINASALTVGATVKLPSGTAAATPPRRRRRTRLHAAGRYAGAASCRHARATAGRYAAAARSDADRRRRPDVHRAGGRYPGDNRAEVRHHGGGAPAPPTRASTRVTCMSATSSISRRRPDAPAFG